MNSKLVLTRLGLIAAVALVASCSRQQAVASSPADQAKLAALKDLRDTGVITAQEYDTKIQSIEAAAAASSPTPAASPQAAPVQTSQAQASQGQTSPSHAAPGSAKTSWSSTRKVEVPDPVYQMTAFTMEIPANWKYAGAIAREPGCHSNGAALKYTTQSPDGLTAIVVLPGVAWSWSSSESMQKIMESSKCPGVDIDSAAKFLLSIAIPNLRPKAKVVAVLPLLPEGQAALAGQLEKERQQNAVMAKQYNAKPQKLTLDGARVRLQYDRDGQPVEELIAAVIECNESTMPGLYKQPAYQQRFCYSRNTTIFRAPQGHLDELMALPQLTALSKSLQVNPDWQNRLTHDQQAAFQKAQAENNARFQQSLKDSKDANDRLLERGREFQQNQRTQTDHAMAADRARQDAIDASAHKMALFANDQQEFINPSTGQAVQASSMYNHQWMSSDGSTLIQTNDHTLDPNGVVYPVSQSWTELVPK